MGVALILFGLTMLAYSIACFWSLWRGELKSNVKYRFRIGRLTFWTNRYAGLDWGSLPCGCWYLMFGIASVVHAGSDCRKGGCSDAASQGHLG